MNTSERGPELVDAMPQEVGLGAPEFVTKLLEPLQAREALDASFVG